MANNYPSPCEKCTRERCYEAECTEWRIRYLYRQKQINAYARKQPKQQPADTKNVFVYEHPNVIRRYLEKGPCEKCQLEQDCDTPCSAYWRWWDARMEWLKRRWGIC